VNPRHILQSYIGINVVAFALLGVWVAIDFHNWVLGAMLPFLGVVIGLWMKELAPLNSNR